MGRTEVESVIQGRSFERIVVLQWLYFLARDRETGTMLIHRRSCIDKLLENLV